MGITAIPLALSALLSFGLFLDTSYAALKSKPKAKSPAAGTISSTPATSTDSSAASADTAAVNAAKEASNDTAKGQANGQAKAEPDTITAAAPGLILDCAAMERRAQEIHPILREKRLDIDKAEQQMRELEMAAILPRFQLETGMGPAPV